MHHPNLSDRVRYHRKIKGYSQEELSKRTNVTVRTIQRIEKCGSKILTSIPLNYWQLH